MKRPRFRTLAVLVGIVFLSVLFSTGAVQRAPFLKLASNWVTDFRVAALAAPEPQHRDIIIIAINEETLKKFPYRSPVDRAFLAGLLAALNAKGARAVFLDVLLDQPTEADKDTLLKQQLAKMTIPTVVSYGFDVTGRTMNEEQMAYLDAFVAPQNRGLANVVKDLLDGTVRWTFPGSKAPDGTYILGVMRKLALQLGINTPQESLRITWRSAPNADKQPFRAYPAHLVPILPADWFRDKIALIGADITLTDRHRTPLTTVLYGKSDREQEGTPGVVIHAHSLAQLLEGRTFPDLDFLPQTAIIVLVTLFAVVLAFLEINLYISLVIGLLLIIAYWMGALLLFRDKTILLPLIAPTLSYVTGFLLTLLFTNIEARKQKKRALEEARIKSEFLANMSHEIRTPMNAVIGMNELVLEMEFDPTKQKYLSTALSSAKSLLALLNDILDYSKMESGKLTLEQIVFDLRQTVENALATLSVPAKNKGLDLILQIDATLPPCFTGDPTRLRQVVVNLAGNAIKFTDKGSVTVSVTTEPDTEGMLRFAVIDTGIGIPEDRLDAIFESFTQADGSTTRQHGGTGLGTTISKQIVESMNGRIWVESEVGKGSTFLFVIQLPVAEGVTSCKEAHGGIATAEKGPRRSYNILLAEDVEENIALATIRLEQRGHRVAVAMNGLEVVKNFGEKDFDLILMDMHMPEMDGLEATRKIRQWEKESGASRAIPIVAMTAAAMKGDRETCLEAGMDDYVSKPIDFIKLFSILAQVMPPDAGEPIEDEPETAEQPPVASAMTHLPPPFNQPLPGLDPALGLATWGNAAAYQKSLLSFTRRHKDAGARLQEALGRGDLKTGKELSHSLKGLAGNLSAVELAEAATALDVALASHTADHTPGESIEKLLKTKNIDLAALVGKVTATMAILVQSCQKLAPEKPKSAPPPAQPARAAQATTRQVAPAQRKRIQELAKALQSGNAVAAASLLAALEKSGVIPVEAREKIAQQIGDFDLLAAGETVEKLLASMVVTTRPKTAQAAKTARTVVAKELAQRKLLQDLGKALQSGNAVAAASLLAALEKSGVIPVKIREKIAQQIGDFDLLEAGKTVKTLLASRAKPAPSKSP